MQARPLSARMHSITHLLLLICIKGTVEYVSVHKLNSENDDNDNDTSDNDCDDCDDYHDDNNDDAELA